MEPHQSHKSHFYFLSFLTFFFDNGHIPHKYCPHTLRPQNGFLQSIGIIIIQCYPHIFQLSLELHRVQDCLQEKVPPNLMIILCWGHKLRPFPPKDPTRYFDGSAGKVLPVACAATESDCQETWSRMCMESLYCRCSFLFFSLFSPLNSIFPSNPCVLLLITWQHKNWSQEGWSRGHWKHPQGLEVLVHLEDPLDGSSILFSKTDPVGKSYKML